MKNAPGSSLIEAGAAGMRSCRCPRSATRDDHVRLATGRSSGFRLWSGVASHAFSASSCAFPVRSRIAPVAFVQPSSPVTAARPRPILTAFPSGARRLPARKGHLKRPYPTAGADGVSRCWGRNEVPSPSTAWFFRSRVEFSGFRSESPGDIECARGTEEPRPGRKSRYRNRSAGRLRGFAQLPCIGRCPPGPGSLECRFPTAKDGTSR